MREEDSNFQVYNMEVAGDRNVGDLITNVELDYEWGKVFGAAFSPDSRRIFLTFQDGTVRYWKRPDTEGEREAKLRRIQEKERLENEERLRLEEEARQAEARRAEEEEELRRAKLEKERLELKEREQQKIAQAEKDALSIQAEDNGDTKDDVVELGLGQATKK